MIKVIRNYKHCTSNELSFRDSLVTVTEQRGQGRESSGGCRCSPEEMPVRLHYAVAMGMEGHGMLSWNVFGMCHMLEFFVRTLFHWPMVRQTTLPPGPSGGRDGIQGRLLGLDGNATEYRIIFFEMLFQFNSIGIWRCIFIRILSILRGSCPTQMGNV